MRTSNDNISIWDRRGFYSNGAYRDAAYNFGHALPNSFDAREAPEEYKHFLSAFQADPKSEAGRRMRMYLMRIRSGAISASYENRSSDSVNHEEAEQRFALAVYMLNEKEYEYQQILMATTALAETGGMFATHRAALQESIAEARAEYEALSARIIESRSEISDQQAHVIDIKTARSAMRENLLETSREAKDIGERFGAINSETVAMENRAIKIVRPMSSIADLKANLTSEETQAPEIYIVSGEDAYGMIYDKLTMDAQGSIIITQVHASEVPELHKDEDNIITDAIERVFFEEDAQGHARPVRAMNGINDKITDDVGKITANMLAQYSSATGKDIREMTQDALPYEQTERAYMSLIDINNSLYAMRKNMYAEYMGEADRLSHIEAQLSDRRIGLESAEAQAAECLTRMTSLQEQCNHFDQLVNLTNEYQEKIGAGDFDTIDDMIAEMPADIRVAFLSRMAQLAQDHVNHTHHAEPTDFVCTVGQKGLNPMNSAWSKASIPAENHGCDGHFAVNAPQMRPQQHFTAHCSP